MVERPLNAGVIATRKTEVRTGFDNMHMRELVTYAADQSESDPR